MPKENWQLVDSQLVRDYRILSIREDRYRFAPSGAESGFVVCDSEDWVLVIPITPDNKVVLVRQYRHGRREVVLEVPGGVMEAGETPAECARRELAEETGYVPESVEMFGPILPNPALNTAQCHVAVATGCRLQVETNLDPFEAIDVVPQPLASIPELIRKGEMAHALCIAAFAISGKLA